MTCIPFRIRIVKHVKYDVVYFLFPFDLFFFPGYLVEADGSRILNNLVVAHGFITTALVTSLLKENDVWTDSTSKLLCVLL